MKKGKLLFVLSFAWLLASCIQKEELNAEADILSCKVSEKEILIGEPTIFDSELDKYNITIRIKKDASNKQITPEFTLTEGATVTPESGVTQDFSNGPIDYIVTSQDGKWKKKYTVITAREIPLKYPFETLLKGENTKYDTFAEYNKVNEEVIRLASGNGGFDLTGKGKTPSEFPTYQAGNGMIGRCAVLVTRKTGFFGETSNMPIAAGNLFMGEFVLTDAVTAPLKATRFGVPFTYEPTRLTGYYKYTPGEKYMDGKTHIQGKTDKADIYAVFYDSTPEEGSDKPITLNGENSLTHKSIIALARQDSIKQTELWEPFDYEFIYKKDAKVDPEKLKNGVYRIALVFSSSIDGASFKGAPGSTLCIDEVEIKIKQQQ